MVRFAWQDVPIFYRLKVISNICSKDLMERLNEE